MRRHHAALVGMAVACCSTARQPVYRAASNDTIESGSEMSYGGDGYTVYVTNDSSVPITVTGLQLYDCENIKSECGPAIEIKVHVEPGRQQNIYTVRIENTTRASHFRFHYTWQPAPAR